MKNHKFKTLKDVIRAMLDGHVFWFNGEKIFYDVESVQPFMFCGNPTKQFTGWKNWKIEHWTDNLSDENPILCWVSKGDSVLNCHTPRVIQSFYENNYISMNGMHYQSAEPVKPEDCWQGDSDEG